MIPMTEKHVEVLDGWTALSHEEPLMSEALAVIKGLANGSLRCADSTEVVVKRKTVFLVLHTLEQPHVVPAAEVAGLLRRELGGWLSTPEQPATENK